MLAKEMISDVVGYNIRSYAKEDEVEIASLYRGKTKIGVITVGADENLVVEIKTDKEDMRYQEAIASTDTPDNFVSELFQHARQKKLEDGIKPRMVNETIFLLKDETADVVALQIPFNQGGREEMERLYPGKVELCYNRLL